MFIKFFTGAFGGLLGGFLGFLLMSLMAIAIFASGIMLLLYLLLG